MIKLLIAGDFCPRHRVTELEKTNNESSIFKEIGDVISQTDYSIVNFECPIDSKHTQAIYKCGPNLKCLPNWLNVIKDAGFNMVTLANNHFYDYGDSAAKETLSYCKENSIDYVGGGENIEEAKLTFYKIIKSKKIAIINICENEFSIATKISSGSNPLNPIDNFYQINDAKKNADYVIVIVHGGHEGYQLPSPRMQDTYRFFIDCGADIIVNHHQHCYSGYEQYKGKYIFYGLGNFCFDDTTLRNNIWNEGYTLTLYIDNGKTEFSLTPYTQCNDEPIIKLMTEDDKIKFDKNILELNSIINDRELLCNSFNNFTDNRRSILSFFEPYNNKYLIALYSRKILPSFLNKRKKTVLLNFIRCESHKDTLINILNKQ